MNFLLERGSALISNIFNSQNMQEEELIEQEEQKVVEAPAPVIDKKKGGLKKAPRNKRPPKVEYKVEKRIVDKSIPINVQERGSQRIKCLSTATLVESKMDKLLTVTHKNKRGREKTWQYPLISEDNLDSAIRDNMKREGRQTLDPIRLAALFPATFWSAALYFDCDLGRIQSYLRDTLQIPTGARGGR